LQQHRKRFSRFSYLIATIEELTQPRLGYCVFFEIRVIGNFQKSRQEMRQFNKRMKELEAEDARRRGGLLTKIMRFFSSKHWAR
jgi:hypothetical protein